MLIYLCQNKLLVLVLVLIPLSVMACGVKGLHDTDDWNEVLENINDGHSVHENAVTEDTHGIEVEERV